MTIGRIRRGVRLLSPRFESGGGEMENSRCVMEKLSLIADVIRSEPKILVQIVGELFFEKMKTAVSLNYRWRGLRMSKVTLS